VPRGGCSAVFVSRLRALPAIRPSQRQQEFDEVTPGPTTVQFVVCNNQWPLILQDERLAIGGDGSWVTAAQAQ
jgi:hypothetical protein